jgi:hypothetical protein
MAYGIWHTFVLSITPLCTPLSTINHIHTFTVKACAAVLSEMPCLNGHVVDGAFYPSRDSQEGVGLGGVGGVGGVQGVGVGGTGGVDVSWSLDLSDRESVLLKVCDADTKSVDAITAEMVRRGQGLREEFQTSMGGMGPSKSLRLRSLRTRLLDLLTPAMAQTVDAFLQRLGHWGVCIPALGVVAFPAGVCAVITSPSMEGDVDVDMSMVPSGEDGAPPFIVSIGSVRVLTSLTAERSVTGSPVLNYSVSIDNSAASAAECRKFCARLQKYLRSPSLLEAKPKATGTGAAGEEAGGVRRKSLF